MKLTPFHLAIPVHDIEMCRKFYKDILGCIEGSSSLYSRSNQIIESGGIIIQSEQMDSREKFGHLKDDILFNNFTQLSRIFDKILNDNFFAKKILEKINYHFSNSNKNVEEELKKYF